MGWVEGLTLVSETNTLALSLEIAKKQLRIEEDVTDQHDLIELCIMTAEELIEEDTARTLIQKTYDLKLQRFQRGPDSSVIRLPRPPTSSVTSITWIDNEGNSDTVSTDVWELDTSVEPNVIRLKYNQSWPSGLRGHPADVTVRFVAGYGTAPKDLPKRARMAMAMLVGHLYSNPEAVVTGTIATELPLGVQRLLYSLDWGHVA